MTFGPHHYVPVLKVKRGEKNALRGISARHKQHITPLLEIVERKEGKTVGSHLDTAFKDLAEGLSSYTRCFLDARGLAPDGPSAASDVFTRALGARIVFTPVTGVSRTADVAAALQHRAHGLGLRLTRDDFEAGTLTTKIDKFVSQHDLHRAETDLIIDLGSVDDMIVDGVAALTRAFLDAVPTHLEWRTFTVSACSFPMGMGGVDRNSHEQIERSEWRAWRDHLHRERASLVRLPTYSDCAIQHPSGVEGFDPRIMQVSAAVRYTLPDEWLLIKGESTRSVPPSVQFPQLAKRLVYGQLKPLFAGASHCAGCLEMKRAADGIERLGSAEVWRRLGTLHHISSVIEEMASLPWP
jgi:hypothetical protein